MNNRTIKTFVGTELVGAIQSISLLDSLQKNSATGYSLWISRMRINKEKLKNIFSGDVFIINAQTYPLQIVIKEDNKEVLRFHNTWISSSSKDLYTYTTGDWTIAQDINLECESISGKFDIWSEAMSKPT